MPPQPNRRKARSILMQKFKVNPAQLFVLEDEQGNKILTVKDGDSYVALRLPGMSIGGTSGISLAEEVAKDTRVG